MSQTIHCQKCNSADVMFSKKKQVYICEDCGYEFIVQKKVIPKHIFISYGRDAYALLAEKLKKDLEARGHEVWFDKDKLKEGSDWEQYINEGLNWVSQDPENGRIVFIMTPHSVRRPDGYCINEIAKALTKSVPIVPVMLVYCEPPLSIYRLQYLDMQDCFPPEEKAITYEKRLERLILAIEEKNLDFEGVQSRLLKALEPISFAADLSKLLKDFTGRQWVFEEVDRWLQNTEGEKIFWITGAPGVGKSAIAAWVRDNRREIAAFHFCDIYSEEKRDPCKLVRSVAYQVTTQLPAYEDRLKGLPLEEIVREYHEAYTLFDKLLVQPLSENFPQPDRNVVILIDALDEATYQKRNEIALLLSRCADKTPPWLRFLVTSRPEPEIRSALQSLSPYVLDTSTEKNRLDITAYLRKKLPHITDEQIESLLEKSEGIFLYARYVCDEIRNGRLSLERLDEFPQGLGDVYLQYFDRQFGKDLTYYENEIRPLLCLVLASFEPLKLGFLMRVLGYKNRMELFDRIDPLGSLFPRTGDQESDTITPFHRSVADWITVKDKAGPYYIDVFYGHELLAEHGWKQYVQAHETMDGYSLEWLLGHLVQINAHEKLVTILKDFNYMMVKLKGGMLERLLEDYRKTLKTIPSEQRLHLRIEEAFFRERAHMLRRGNEEWPAYKILLQLAIEHADDSPVTRGAEQYLSKGKCDWIWLRRDQRVKNSGIDSCRAVLEHTEGVSGAIKLSDGRILSCSWDSTLRMWDGEGQPLAVLMGHTSTVNGALNLSDGRILSWSGDKTLRMWSREGHPLTILEGHTNWVHGAIELGDGRILSWSHDKTLRMWDRDGKQLTVLDGHKNYVRGAIELRGGRILSWSRDSTLRLWDREGQPLTTLEGHISSVEGALEIGDGIILSWTEWGYLEEDYTLRLWDRDGQPLAVLMGHTNRVLGALNLSDGRILSWSSDGTLRMWDRDGQPLIVLAGHTKSVCGAIELGDGRILSWSWDNTLRLWDRDGTLPTVLEGHTGMVNGALELGDGHILSWAMDRTLRLWNREGEPVNVLKGHAGLVEGALELGDGRILSWSGVSWLGDKTLRMWDGEGQPLAVLMGHTSTVNGALNLSDGRILSWSSDETLRLWDREGQPLIVLAGHTKSVRGAIELGDGRILSWSWDSALRLWDREGQPLVVLVGHTKSVCGAIELGDGRILSWSDDKTLRLWDREGQPLIVLEGRTFELRDGHIISWSKYDNTLRLWNREGHPLTVLEGQTDWVRGAMERTDGHIISWSKYDNTLRLWNKEGQPLIVLVAERVDGALKLSDDRILSWSNGKILFGESGAIGAAHPYLWKQDGEPFTVHAKYEGVWHPDARKAILGEERVVSHSWLSSAENAAVLHVYENHQETVTVWHGVSKCEPHLLKSDGRAVVTQDNGQVCFLKLYHGNKRIQIDELESINRAKTGKND